MEKPCNGLKFNNNSIENQFCNLAQESIRIALNFYIKIIKLDHSLRQGRLVFIQFEIFNGNLMFVTFVLRKGKFDIKIMPQRPHEKASKNIVRGCD